MIIERCAVALWDGAESMGFLLRSDRVEVTVADLGAHLTSVVLRLSDDDEVDVVVGYPTGTADAEGYHGGSVGRYANRIAGSAFELDGVRYELEPNEGPNQLHGGPRGFHRETWSASAETIGDTGRIELRHVSPDGDQGFPGQTDVVALFELADDRLQITYRADVTAPTPVNLTNHAYWNLAGHGSLGGHELRLRADAYVAVDEANIPVPGPPQAVEGTTFDCLGARSLGEIVEAGGYDHCFVLNDDTGPAAELTHESGRAIELTTNQIGLQVYTGRHLDPSNRGVALETQALPDTPNRPDFGDVTLRPGESYEATTTLRFRS